MSGKILKINKRASYDYFILETFCAGISLNGGEVKSMKAGNMSLQEGFVRIRKGEAFLINVYVAPYQKTTDDPEAARRTRKLLLSKKEISYLDKKMLSGFTIVPLKAFTERGLIKIEIGLAQGKKKYDKREILKKKAIKREIEIEMKEKQRN